MNDQNLFYQQLEEQNDADYVKVVRCKDCSSWGTITIVIDNNKSIVACDCLDFGTLTKPDFFCAWGEKGDVDRTKSGKMDEVEDV